MVNTILSTFDAGLDQNNPISRFLWHATHTVRLQSSSTYEQSSWISLYSKLEELGVKVETYEPSNIDLEEDIKLLEKSIQESDIVVHGNELLRGNALSNGLISIMNQFSLVRRSPFISKDLASRVDELINGKYLHKSHISLPEDYGLDKLIATRRMQKAGIPTPETMEVEEYLATRDGPAVLKPRVLYQGNSVLYLEKEQIERFFDEKTWHGKHGKVRARNIPQPGKYFVQEFIETPSDRFTSYRVVAVGDIIVGCVITASGQTKSEIMNGVKAKDFYQILARMFNTYPIVSNVAAGGIQIPVSHDSYKQFRELEEWEKQALMAHNIDPDNLGIPEPLRKLATSAGRVAAKYGLLISGQDWLQDRDGRVYFSEVNKYPALGLEIFNTLFLGGRGKEKQIQQVAEYQIADALQKYNPPNLVR